MDREDDGVEESDLEEYDEEEDRPEFPVDVRQKADDCSLFAFSAVAVRFRLRSLKHIIWDLKSFYRLSKKIVGPV